MSAAVHQMQIRAALLGWAIAAMVAPQVGCRAGANADLCYVPFDLHTLYWITPDNIDEGGHRRSISMADSHLKLIMAAFGSTGPGDFDDKRVRLKIRTPNGEVILVDQRGGLRRDAGESKLPSEALETIISSMNELIPTPDEH